MSLNVNTVVKDDKKMRKLISEGVSEKDRAALWKAAVEHHTGHALDLTAYDDAVHLLFHAPTIPLFYPVIPDFGSPVEWDHPDELKRPPPSTQSQQSLLCLLASQHHQLTHCPFLVDLLPLLLRYFDDRSTYALTCSMLTPLSSSPSLSFYFTLSSSAYLVLLKKFYLFLKLDNEKLKHHLKHLGVDSVTMFNNWVERLFVSFLPQSSLYRFMDGFLHFGMAWLWAFALAMLEVHRKGLLGCATIEAMSEYVYGEVSMGEVTEYVDRALDIVAKVAKANDKVKAKDIERYAMGAVPHARETMFHSPAFPAGQLSEMMDDTQLSALWCWLEAEERICNPRLLYASSAHGYLLKTLIERVTTSDPHTPHGPTVTLVKASTGAVFGVYLTASWVKESDAVELRRSQYAGDDEKERAKEEERKKHRLPSVDGRCFLFQLAPAMAAYRQPQQRLERLRLRKDREDRENARRSLIAGRDGLRHSTTSSHEGSSASKHLSLITAQHSASFIHAELPASSPLSPTAVRPKDDAGEGTGGGDGVTRSALAEQLVKLLESQRAEEGEEEAVHMMCNQEYIAVGDSGGVGFSLDRLLRKGVSQGTRRFGNGSLAESKEADGSFECLAVEVWGFKKPHEA